MTDLMPQRRTLQEMVSGAGLLLAQAGAFLSSRAHYWPAHVHRLCSMSVAISCLLGLGRVSLVGAVAPILVIGVLAFYVLYRDHAMAYAIRAALNARLAYDHDFLHHVLADVPTWVTFRDNERCRWLQGVLTRIWPAVSEAGERSVRSLLTPELLESVRPPFLQKLQLTEFRLGRQGPQLAGINVRTRENALHIDLDVRWITNSEVGLSAHTSLVSLPLRLTNFSLAGTLRIMLSPLCNKPPYCKAVAVTFVGRPDIRYELAAVRLPLSSIPGIADFIHNLVEDTVTQRLMYPRKVVLPVGPLSAPEYERLGTIVGEGILHVHLISASGLKGAGGGTLSLLGHPYAVCSLDGTARSTRPTDEGVNPVWNEEFEWVVFDGATSTFSCHIRIAGGMVESGVLGHIEVDVHSLRWNVPEHMDLPLVDGEGRVRLELTYQPFLSPAAAAAAAGAASAAPTPSSGGSTISRGVSVPPPMLPGRAMGALFVKLKRCFGLPEPGSTRVKLSCCGTAFHSLPISGRGSFPFDEDFVFPLTALDEPLRLELDGCNAGIAIIDVPRHCGEDGTGVTLVQPLAKGQAGYVEIRMAPRLIGPLDSNNGSSGGGTPHASAPDELPEVWGVAMSHIEAATHSSPIEESAAVLIFSTVAYIICYFGGLSWATFLTLTYGTLRLAQRLGVTDEVYQLRQRQRGWSANRNISGGPDASGDAGSQIGNFSLRDGGTSMERVSSSEAGAFTPRGAISTDSVTTTTTPVPREGIIPVAHFATLSPSNPSASPNIPAPATRVGTASGGGGSTSTAAAAASSAASPQSPATPIFRDLSDTLARELSLFSPRVFDDDANISGNSASDHNGNNNNGGGGSLFSDVLGSDSSGGSVQGLPAWVVFPDAEKSFWFQKILEALWPRYVASTDSVLLSALQVALANLSADYPLLDPSEITSATLGELSPVLTGIKEYPSAAKICIDMSFIWASNVNVEARVGIAGFGALPVRLSQCCIASTLRLVLDPLVPVLPCISAIEVAMVHVPKLAFHLDVGPFRITSVPGLSHAVRRAARRALVDIMAWPTRVITPTMDMTAPDVLTALRPMCAGVLRVHVLGAHNLQASSTMTLSRTFCVLTVGGAVREQQTLAADHGDHPRWDERFEFIVERPQGALEATIFSRGLGKYTRELGAVRILLSLFEPDTLTHCRAPLTIDGENAGYLALTAEWKPFLEPTSSLSATSGGGGSMSPSRRGTRGSASYAQSSAHWSSAVLFCKAVQGLSLMPSPIRRERSHYYVETRLGSQHVRTRTVPGPNPIFDTTMYLLVQNPAVQQLLVVVQSARAVRDVPVGRLEIPVADIVRSSGVVLGTWSLRDTRTGELNLNLAVRFVRPGVVKTASLNEAEVRQANLEAQTARAIAEAVSRKHERPHRSLPAAIRTVEEDTGLAGAALSFVGSVVGSYLAPGGSGGT